MGRPDGMGRMLVGEKSVIIGIIGIAALLELSRQCMIDLIRFL